MRGGRERDFCSRRITVNALLSMAKPEEIKCICCICTHTHTERERERERERGRAGGREGDVCVLDRTSKLSRVVEGCVGEIDWLPVQSDDAVSHSDGIVIFRDTTMEVSVQDEGLSLYIMSIKNTLYLIDLICQA